MNIRIPALATAAALLAAVAMSTPASARTIATGCKAAPGMHLATTASYRLALRVGMPEKMYTRAQVRKMHPRHGEVMLRGSMSGSGMQMSGATRHLEVQLCSRGNRAVLTNAHPRITITDDTAKGMSMNVPIAVMEGIGAGVADLHYGNNVAMPGGHKFTVRVSLNGQRASLRISSPR